MIPPPDSLRQVNTNVVLPTGSALDPTSLTVSAQLFESPVAADGSAPIALEENGRVLALVFDADGQPILAGFVTDAQTEVSVETTVQASLFVGLGTVLLPTEVQDLFWGGVTTFPGYQQLLTDAQQLFQNDPLAFQGDAYRDLITNYLADLLAPVVINPRLTTDGNIRSGLQLMEVPGDAVNIVQNLRRRCHAFVYKVNRTTNDDVLHTLIEESDFPGGSPPSLRDLIVSPAAAFNSAVGTIQNAAGGKGLEFFAKESGPIDLSLSSGEKRQPFAVRVIGPSFTPGQLTTAEERRLRRLELETFAFDYVYPAIMMALNEC